uniref:Ig-like domain-containing protein n=1 Tax=Sinocyclocheilus anshuiensis TaxID=1608454 RepID=A0A671KW39_9TELE
MVCECDFLSVVGLLVWCQAVETLTELTNLGQNVSINCDLEEKEIYWMLLKLPNRPVMILRLFSTSPTPFYYDASFRPKYSVHPKHHLFIKNVTLDELGVYYCMTTEAPPKFSNGTRLHIIVKVSVISVSLQVIVEAVIGGSVVLPCSSTQHDLELQDINVHWRHNGSKYVYDITKRKDSLEQQDPRYKNRAQTFPEEYERRNFSIKLINLTHADAGEFSCFITHSSYSKQETVWLFHYSLEKKNSSSLIEGQVSNCLFLLYSRMRS